MHVAFRIDDPGGAVQVEAQPISHVARDSVDEQGLIPESLFLLKVGRQLAGGLGGIHLGEDSPRHQNHRQGNRRQGASHRGRWPAAPIEQQGKQARARQQPGGGARQRLHRQVQPGGVEGQRQARHNQAQGLVEEEVLEPEGPGISRVGLQPQPNLVADQQGHGRSRRQQVPR